MIDSFCDLVDDNSVDVHMSLSCSKTKNDDASNDYHDHHMCWNTEISKPHIQIQCGWIDVPEWQNVVFMWKGFYKVKSSNVQQYLPYKVHELVGPPKVSCH